MKALNISKKSISTLSLAIGLVVASFSHHAHAKTTSVAPTAPTVNWSLDCTGDSKCISNTPDNRENHKANSIDGSTDNGYDNDPEAGSLGWGFLNGKFPNDQQTQAISGYTVQVTDATGLNSMIMGVSKTGYDTVSADHNAVYIGNASGELTFNWNGVSDYNSVREGANIAGAGVTSSTGMTNNTLAIRNTTFNLVDATSGDGQKAFNSNLVMAGAVISIPYSDPNKDSYANFSDNHLVLQNVKIHGKNHENVAQYGFYLALYNFDDTKPKNFDMKNNGVWVENSDLDTVSMLGGTTYTFVDMTSEGNTVSIKGSTVNFDKQKDWNMHRTGYLAGSDGATVGQNNAVYVESSTLNFSNNSSDDSFGFNLAGFTIGEEKALNNQVTLKGVTVNLAGSSKANLLIAGGAVNSSAAYATTTATGNQVTVAADDAGHRSKLDGSSNSQVNMYGARLYARASGSGSLNGITLDSVDATAPLYMVGLQNVAYGAQQALDSHNNYVNVSNAQISDLVAIYGNVQQASSSLKDPIDTSSNFSSTNNTVTIDNTTIQNTDALIVGGYIALTGGTQRAEDNTVTIGSNVTGQNGGVLTLKGLYGGLTKNGDRFGFKGNTLNVASRIVTTDLGGFQNFNFDLTNITTEPVISVTGDKPVLLVTDADSPNKTNVTITAKGADTPDNIVLIHSKAGFAELNLETGNTTILNPGQYDDLLADSVTVRQVKSLAREENQKVDLSQAVLSIENDKNSARGVGAAIDGQNLVLSLSGSSTTEGVNQATNALMESSLSSYGTLTAADDLMWDQMMRSSDMHQDGAFAAARTGRWSFDTNTRITSNITNGVVGVRTSVENTRFGGFVEVGMADYRTRTGLADGSTAEGKGTHNYAGVGIFFDQGLGVSGLSLTGSAKVGALQNKFSVSLADTPTEFNRTNAYWGAQLALVYEKALSAKVTSRSFVGYFYDGLSAQTYDVAGDSAAMQSSFHYDALNGHRLAIGSQITYDYQPNLKPFVGITLEQTWAQATGTATDAQGALNLNGSDMNGLTGVMNAGWKYTSEDGRREFGVSATGYGGARNGVSAQIQGTLRF